MSEKFVYAIGAALVDTEVTVSDQDLEQLGIEKGTMTLVDENRQREIKHHLASGLSHAHHACGGSAGTGTADDPGSTAWCWWMKPCGTKPSRS